MSSQKQARIYGLDAAKAVLLLGGPLVHATFSQYSTLPLQVMVETSHLFRMSAFFAIAGFLAALSARTLRPGWITGRMRQLIVPLVSMCAVMYLLAIWAQHFYPTVNLIPPFVPLHLWFLVALAAVSPLSIWLDTSRWGPRIFAFYDNRPFVFLTTGIMVSLILVGENRLVEKAISHLSFDVGWVVPILLTSAPKFAVYYLSGCVLARNVSLQRAFNTNTFLASSVGVLVLTLTFFAASGGDMLVVGAFSVSKLLFYVLQEITQMSMSIAVLCMALRVKSIHHSVAWFSQSSYTVYLFHFPFIILVAYPLVTYYPTINPYLLFSAGVVSSLMLSYSTHFVVSRSNLLMFLFNGKKLS